MPNENQQNDRIHQLHEKARKLIYKKMNAEADHEDNFISDVLIGQELQIEELQRANKILENSAKKYQSLFMFAPVGYYILDAEKYISEVNLLGADFLALTRDALANRNFTRYVADEDKEHFADVISECSRSNDNSVAHIHLVREDNESFLAEIICDKFDDFDGKDEFFRLTVMDISRSKVYQKLEERSAQLKNLTAHLHQVQEEEREKASKIIHDELGQSLTALKMDIVWIKNKVSEEKKSIREKLDDMIRNLETNIYLVQKVTSKLRPGMIHELGLKAAIEWEIETIRDKIGLQGEFKPYFDDTSIDNIVALDIYRIVKELLTNTVRHSGATALFLEMRRESDSLLIRFRDNGKGTSRDKLNAHNAFGIIGIKERVQKFNGDVIFDTDLSVGMEVRIRLPLFN